MKLKFIAIALLFIWTSCSSPEEKKSEKENEQVEEAESPSMDEAVEEMPEEEIMSEELSEEPSESPVEESKKSSPFDGMDKNGNGTNSGSESRSLNGSGVTKKSIEMKNEITVGEEGVR